MRLFQNAGLYPAYRRRLSERSADCTTFAAHIERFLQDRYGACHILTPILRRQPQAFFTNADHPLAQQAWAREKGMRATASADEILLAQIEEHRTEVFYNLDPMRFGNNFLSRLPSSVRCSIAWRAAPSGSVDLSRYDLLVCNFPSILDSYRRIGWKAGYLAPGHDPAMDAYAANLDRPIDLLFVGTYSRHHRRRAALLEAVAGLRGRFRVEFRLEASRMTQWAESPLGQLLPLGRHRRPRLVREVCAPPVFGRDLYEAISRAKIVLNGAVDMAGEDRGNMRCFEAMGCGAMMLSDAGRYPSGMNVGDSMCTYADNKDALRLAVEMLADGERLRNVARQGHAAVSTAFSKDRQWQSFQALVEANA